MLGICNLVTSEGSWEHNLRLDQLEGTRELPFSSGRGRSHATEGSDLLVFDVALEAELLPLFFCVDPPGIRVCARIATIVDDCPYVRIGVRINNSQRGGASVFALWSVATKAFRSRENVIAAGTVGAALAAGADGAGGIRSASTRSAQSMNMLPMLKRV